MSFIYNGMQILRRGTTNSGTLGGFFTFGGNEIFGISNNHVLANFGFCEVGDFICRAGSDIVVGSLQCWVKLDLSQSNYLDIALFKLAPDVKPYWRMPFSHNSSPGNIRLAEEGESVYMVANNGSIKTGIINQLFTDEDLNVDLNGNNLRFLGLTEVLSTSGIPFSVQGESGSLVFGSNNDLLGILMGSSKNNSSLSYYVPFIHQNLGICAVYPNIRVWNPAKNYS